MFLNHAKSNFCRCGSGCHCDTLADLIDWLREEVVRLPLELQARIALVPKLQAMRDDGVRLIQFILEDFDVKEGFYGEEAVLGTDDEVIATKHGFAGNGHGGYTRYETYCPSYGLSADDLDEFIRKLREGRGSRTDCVSDAVETRLELIEELEDLLEAGYEIDHFDCGWPGVVLVSTDDPEDTVNCRLRYPLS